MLTANSRSLLVTWPYDLTQETICAVISAGKCVHHMMGYATSGYGDVAAALVCGWGVRGTAMGPGSTAPPHIHPKALV